MKDMIANLKESPKKLALFVGVPVLGILVVIVLVVAMSGGAEEPEEVTFVFDDEVVDDEPSISVEEQVRRTVEASLPTPTPKPTEDIPATIAAEAQRMYQERLQSNPLQPGVRPTPPGFESLLSPADVRYLNSFGRPVWLATNSYLRLSILFDQLPEEVLTQRNVPVLQQVQSDARRASTILEEGVYLQHDVTPAVRDYGIFVEETVNKIRDAANVAAVMFSEVDFADEVYTDLPRERRGVVDDYYHRVSSLLVQFETDMARYGCSACGELYRGR